MKKTEKLLSQAIAERRATPSFDGSPMPPEDLRAILEAGLKAPSGYNIQPWRFVVVQSPEQKKRLRAASYNHHDVHALGHTWKDDTTTAIAPIDQARAAGGGIHAQR